MRSTKRQDEILSIAKQHFATLGYDSATLSEIAADANTSKSTLSYYFNTKEQLFDHILRDAVCNLNSRMAQIAVSRSDAGVRIAKMARTYFTFLLTEGDVQVILEKEAARLSRNQAFDYVAQARIDIDDAWQHVVTDAIGEDPSIRRPGKTATARRVVDAFAVATLDEMDCDHRTRRYLKDVLTAQISAALMAEDVGVS